MVKKWYFDPTNNPNALSSNNGLGGTWDQNNVYNLQPSDYGTAVFGVVTNFNKTKWYAFPAPSSEIGVPVGFAGIFYQVDYNFRLTDGGGLSTDYLVKLQIQQTI